MIFSGLRILSHILCAKNLDFVHFDIIFAVAFGTETAKVHTATAKWTGDSDLSSPQKLVPSFRGPQIITKKRIDDTRTTK